ncbi:MAG: LPS-assembly protein LptD, partial [Selenomonadaceae bacterium]|nr:LPS-assembly protein LptD [Selenomonadaceae bacterium]
EHWDLNVNAYIESKKGVRSNAELEYKNRNVRGWLKYGFYDDSNARWIQKEPSIDIWYGQHLKDLPLSYSIEGEVGHWRQRAVSSTHQEYEFKLTHDPIFIENYMLLLSTGYKITKDEVKNLPHGETTVNGFNYSILFGREFNERLAAFVGYSYNKNNSRNSVFNFDLDDYSRKFQAGVSYYITPKDRVVIGMKWNADDHNIDDIDYYWYHDLHCSQAVLRWRGKRKKLEVHWEFVPW